MKKVKVFIIDDSASVRQTLSRLLASDPAIEVIGTAFDPFNAAEKLETITPDVITLDIEMPRMDGITFLKKIMTQFPIPVVICSSLAEKGSETTFKTIEYGAVEIIEKPKIGTKTFFEESKIMICDTVKAASKVNVKKLSLTRSALDKKLSADAIIPRATSNSMIKTTEKLLIVGASTGGTEAIRIFLESMPLDAPGIVIVQHMPENFTKAFANRINTLCKITVKEASDNDTVIPGQALIAPGNKHMLLKRSGARYYVQIKAGPLVSRHRPSVDVLFRSAARYAGKNAIGIIMTGMGDDGAKGMLEMKEAGAYTIAQDEKSCIVFGMPNEAIKLGGINKVLSLKDIAQEALNYC
jgi:two-component system chemotaxis response regulator CheB